MNSKAFIYQFGKLSIHWALVGSMLATSLPISSALAQGQPPSQNGASPTLLPPPHKMSYMPGTLNYAELVGSYNPAAPDASRQGIQQNIEWWTKFFQKPNTSMLEDASSQSSRTLRLAIQMVDAAIEAHNLQQSTRPINRNDVGHLSQDPRVRAENVVRFFQQNPQLGLDILQQARHTMSHPSLSAQYLATRAATPDASVLLPKALNYVEAVGPYDPTKPEASRNMIRTNVEWWNNFFRNPTAESFSRALDGNALLLEIVTRNNGARPNVNPDFLNSDVRLRVASQLVDMAIERYNANKPAEQQINRHSVGHLDPNVAHRQASIVRFFQQHSSLGFEVMQEIRQTMTNPSLANQYMAQNAIPNAQTPSSPGATSANNSTGASTSVQRAEVPTANSSKPAGGTSVKQAFQDFVVRVDGKLQTLSLPVIEKHELQKESPMRVIERMRLMHSTVELSWMASTFWGAVWAMSYYNVINNPMDNPIAFEKNLMLLQDLGVWSSIGAIGLASEAINYKQIRYNRELLTTSLGGRSPLDRMRHIESAAHVQQLAIPVDSVLREASLRSAVWSNIKLSAPIKSGFLIALGTMAYDIGAGLQSCAALNSPTAVSSMTSIEYGQHHNRCQNAWNGWTDGQKATKYGVMFATGVAMRAAVAAAITTAKASADWAKNKSVVRGLAIQVGNKVGPMVSQAQAVVVDRAMQNAAGRITFNGTRIAFTHVGRPALQFIIGTGGGIVGAIVMYVAFDLLYRHVVEPVSDSAAAAYAVTNTMNDLQNGMVRFQKSGDDGWTNETTRTHASNGGSRMQDILMDFHDANQGWRQYLMKDVRAKQADWLFAISETYHRYYAARTFYKSLVTQVLAARAKKLDMAPFAPMKDSGMDRFIDHFSVNLTPSSPEEKDLAKSIAATATDGSAIMDNLAKKMPAPYRAPQDAPLVIGQNIIRELPLFRASPLQGVGDEYITVYLPGKKQEIGLLGFIGVQAQAALEKSKNIPNIEKVQTEIQNLFAEDERSKPQVMEEQKRAKLREVVAWMDQRLKDQNLTNAWKSSVKDVRDLLASDRPSNFFNGIQTLRRYIKSYNDNLPGCYPAMMSTLRFDGDVTAAFKDESPLCVFHETYARLGQAKPMRMGERFIESNDVLLESIGIEPNFRPDKYNGWETENMSQYLAYTALCGPDVAEQRELFKFENGWAAEFNPPRIIKSRDFCDQKKYGPFNLFNAIADNTARKIYWGFPQVLADKIDPVFLSTDFDIWWDTNVKPGFIDTLKRAQKGYEQLVIKERLEPILDEQRVTRWASMPFFKSENLPTGVLSSMEWEIDVYVETVLRPIVKSVTKTTTASALAVPPIPRSIAASNASRSSYPVLPPPLPAWKKQEAQEAYAAMPGNPEGLEESDKAQMQQQPSMPLPLETPPRDQTINSSEGEKALNALVKNLKDSFRMMSRFETDQLKHFNANKAAMDQALLELKVFMGVTENASGKQTLVLTTTQRSVVYKTLKLIEATLAEGEGIKGVKTALGER